MSLPKFSRIEIRHDTPDEVIRAAASLRSLADRMTTIAADIADREIMQAAVHNEIRKTSGPLRGGATE